MAGSTRLELATSGVTGRRSNQLNYDPAILFNVIIYQPANGTECANNPSQVSAGSSGTLVGETGLEPVTPGL